MLSRVTLALALSLLLSSCSSIPGTRPAQQPSATPVFKIQQNLYHTMPPGSGHLEISLQNQTLTLFNSSRQPVITTDCSTGIPGKETPTGSFRILEKITEKRSNLYGKYISRHTGEVIVPKSWEVPGPPPGTQFLGTAMPYWMRLTWHGVGIHVGHFPRGYRSSFGCIRVPEPVQPLIYQKCRIGTPVHIQ